MTPVLQDLPFHRAETTAGVPKGPPVLVKDHQAIVWVSLGPFGERQLRPDPPRFPAILDTGNNFNFSIQERHFVDWTGLRLEDYPPLRYIQLGEDAKQRLPILPCNVWLHRN